MIRDNSGKEVGSYTIDKDGKVKMTFDDGKINPANAFNGTLMFTARANYSSSKDGRITFGNNISLKIQEPVPDLNVTKGFAENVMWSDAEGNFYIYWKVTVTTKNGSGGKVAEVSLHADENTDVIDLAAADKAQKEDRPAAGDISHEELGEQESALVIWPISEEELAQYPMMLSAELDETDAAGNQALNVTKVTFQKHEGNNWPDIKEGDTVKEDDEIRMYVDFTLAPNTFTQLPGTVYYQLPGGL